MRIAIIISTNGGVMSKLINIEYFKERLSHVISDRPCGAIELAKNYKIKNDVFPSKTGREFSDTLTKYINWNDYDLIISFYTRLFAGEFLSNVKHKLINLHPSILPACPGMNGFEDTLRSGSKFIGSTVHFIDEGIDTGKPIIQSARPYDSNRTEAENRHLLFMDQCITLLQTIKWFDEKRVKINENDTTILNAKYNPSVYAPNIDFKEALNLKID